MIFGAIPKTKTDNVEISPTIFYPDHGDSVYIGLKMKFESEEMAKYFMRCVEEASK